jgi:lipopolysaccharide biosynthesis glycosyltransferase
MTSQSFPRRVLALLRPKSPASTRTDDNLKKLQDEFAARKSALEDQFRSEQARARDLEKQLAAQTKSNSTLQVFLSRLATLPWKPVPVAKALHDLHADAPSIVMSLIFGLMGTPATRRCGLLALVRIQSKRRIYSFVAELLDEYPPDEIVTDCLSEALAAYSHVRPGAVRPLVESALDGEAFAAIAAEPAHETRFRDMLLAAASIDDVDLARTLLDRLPPPRNPGEKVDTYGHVHHRARVWVERSGRSAGQLLRPDSIALGVLSYRSPVSPSTNIGDYIQTIAMLGLLARHLPEDLAIPEGKVDGGADVVRRILAKSTAGTADRPGHPVDLVWVDRDCTSTTPGGRPVWLPLNGWFMHPTGEDRFDFPFADNVRPIFIGIHINRPEILTDDVVSYLKKYAPIGTRDHFTEQLLLANGVDAFFSGCPTLTLDSIFPRSEETKRKGKYFAAHRLPKTPSKSHPKQRLHLHPSLAVATVEDALEQALAYLTDYSRAVHVETPLLHCYLPCRAMGTPVAFTHANQNDPRFEGLIGISEEERQVVRNRIEGLLAAVMDPILAGAGEEAVYASWRTATADLVAAARRRQEAMKAKSESIAVSGDQLASVRWTTFRAGDRVETPKSTTGMVNVVFCYDANFEKAATVTLRSLVENTNSALCVTLLTREVGEESIAALSRTHPQLTIVWIDVTNVTFAGLNLLRHTTVSTMDRLFLPSLMHYAPRTIYLDVDIVVLDDIAKLYAIDLDGYDIAGRTTIYPGWQSGFYLAKLIEKQLNAEQIVEFRREFTFSRRMYFSCFNAGVQVLDLDALRKNDFTGRMLSIVDRYGINDQYAVNLYASGKYASIPNEWNHIPTQEKIDAPKLIHYTGYIKPWDSEYSPKAEHWRRYIHDNDGLIMRPAIEKDWFK